MNWLIHHKGSIHSWLISHFYMTHVHILRGWNFTSCTFVGGENYRRDAYIKGGEAIFYEKTLFCLVLPYACFLIVLWCFDLCLVSMLCSIFLIFLSFICASFSHLFCTPHASYFTLIHIFFSFPPSSWFICLFVTRRGKVY